jgi:hypothetical protein
MFMHVRRPSHRIGSVCFSALARSRPLLYYHFTLRQHQVIMRREKCASCSSTLSRYTIPFSLQAAGTSLGIGRLLSCFISTMLGQRTHFGRPIDAETGQLAPWSPVLSRASIRIETILKDDTSPASISSGLGRGEPNPMSRGTYPSGGYQLERVVNVHG